MKYLITGLSILFCLQVFAHEGAEMVQAKFAPRFGGKVSHVEKKTGHHHEDRYVGELIVSDEGVMRLFFYDLAMKDISIAKFPAEVKGAITSKKDKTEIVLKKGEKNYTGTLPRVKARPYRLEFNFNVNGENLSLGFKAMD